LTVTDDLGARKAAWPERAGILDLGFDRERTILLADARRHARHAALVTRAAFVDLDAHGLSDVDALRVALRQIHTQTQRIDPDQRRNRSAHRQILARTDQALFDEAIERRADRGVLKLLLRKHQLRATLAQHRLTVSNLLARVVEVRLCAQKCRIRSVEVGARNQFLLHELACPLEIAPRFVERGVGRLDAVRLLHIDGLVGSIGRETEQRARLSERRRRLIDAQLIVRELDLRDRLVARDGTAEVDRDRGKTSRHLRAQRHLFVRGETSRDHDQARHRLLARLDELHRDFRRRCLLVTLFALTPGRAGLGIRATRTEANGQPEQHDSGAKTLASRARRPNSQAEGIRRALHRGLPSALINCARAFARS